MVIHHRCQSAKQIPSWHKGDTLLQFKASQSQEEAYGPRATVERVGKIEGGYLPADKQIHIIADNIRSENPLRIDTGLHQTRSEMGTDSTRGISGDPLLREPWAVRTATEAIKTTWRHEVLGHYGLNTFSPEDKTVLGKS